MLSICVEKQLRDFALEVSLEVGEGETLVLIGENGAGKSTLLNLISGLITPDGGQIALGERVLFSRDGRVDVMPEGRNIGHLFQSYALFPHLSVFENIAFGLRCRKLTDAEISSRIQEYLLEMNLESLSEEKACNLSGGQRQRVALARALVLEPDLLLLDEPLAALDVKSKETMRKELRSRIADAGIPAVIVTHALRDALELGDRIAVMEEGRITLSGTPDEILRPGKNSFVASFFCGCVHGSES